jgi:hypothetical protein
MILTALKDGQIDNLGRGQGAPLGLRYKPPKTLPQKLYKEGADGR